ncbi:hypothetical protein Nm8I071_43270 [Nonomuraea sp. TT08I-71]|nr:hypothetical protein Nm8I071_43270 [Nonomuraea sp. TT08I-71]
MRSSRPGQSFSSNPGPAVSSTRCGRYRTGSTTPDGGSVPTRRSVAVVTRCTGAKSTKPPGGAAAPSRPPSTGTGTATPAVQQGQPRSCPVRPAVPVAATTTVGGGLGAGGPSPHGRRPARHRLPLLSGGSP